MRNDRLRATRTKRGYTQEALGEMLGVEKKQISRWETGDVTPGSEKLAEIARVLKVSTDFLLDLSDDPVIHIQIDRLSEDEYEVISAMRRGEKLEAIKIISGT